jgi:hypothetical protein
LQAVIDSLGKGMLGCQLIINGKYQNSCLISP